jgi:predicted alpha/beta hydrolase
MSFETIEQLVELPPFSVPALIYHADSPRCLVILLPAMGTAAGFYGPFAEQLAGRNVSVLVPELPGTGTSHPRPSWSADYGYRDLIETYFPAVVAKAREMAAGVPVVVIGHSLGAQVATLGLAGGIAAIDGLISVASGHIHYENWDGAAAVKVLFGSVLFPSLTYFLGHMPGQYFGFGGPQARTLIRDWAKIIRSGGLSHIAPQLDPPDSVPSLFIGFEGDDFSPPKSVSGLAELLSGQMKILPVNWPGNPHSSWARNPSELTQIVGDWLEENQLAT